MQLKQGRVQMCVATRYATHQEVEFKCVELHSEEWSSFIDGGRRWITDIFIIL